jgi:ornithine decarboxylase
MEEVAKAHSRWTTHLPNVTPYYAVKCNPDRDVLGALARLGANFDCASKSEIAQVLAVVDGDASRIIYANPIKARSHLEWAREVGVELLTFDCAEELAKIREFHPTARLLLRIAVNDSHSLCKFNSKFGCSPDMAEELVRCACMLGLELVGVCFHVGSGCYDATAFYEAIRDARTVWDMAATQGCSMSILDIGGGFPGSNNDHFQDIATQVRSGLRDFFAAGVRVMAEPGRFFVERACTLVLTVIGKKKLADDRIAYYLNDGAYGCLNCIRMDHARPILRPLCETPGPPRRSVVFGPTCDSLDVIYEDTMLAEMDVGDCVFIPNMGAYTTAAQSAFNGFGVTKKVY